MMRTKITRCFSHIQSHRYVKRLFSTFSFQALFIAICLINFGCQGKTADITELLDERDSLKMVTEQQRKDLAGMDELMGIVTSSLDSITAQEGMIKMKANEGSKVSKEELKSQLEFLANLVARQHSRITALSDSLRAKNDTTATAQPSARISQLLAIIDYLNQQLDEKTATIQKLRAQLNSQSVDIATLRTTVSSLNTSVSNLTTTNEAQQQALKVQDEVINEGYVCIGTKKQLSSQGLLQRKNVFSKRKLNIDGVGAANMQKVDIRVCVSIPVQSSKIKLLTSHPSSSYSISTSGKTSTLTISNPTSFWSVSNYLIIQTD